MERAFGELVRELEQDFPSDKIHEALKRLVDRRYVVPASRSSAGAVAAYWASLGLSPETAEKNLQNCRVRIQSIDVQGATELGAALSELGVRVVKRSPDLTVTLVSDYLEGRLAELNRQHLSDHTPWLLVQPSGIFPLVGPVFSPGKSACWTCLADRMKRNREVKALLDRGQARCVAVSPLARHTLGQSAIQLAAVEIAKAIATDFRTELRDHIISLDLLGSTIVKHYVAARPQCPSCGRKKLRDPRRAPVPIELGAGGKLVMTSGGYRTVSPRATVARFRKHVSPLTGVVSRLERIEADLPLNTNYYAAHNFSAPAKTVDELRAGLSGGSFGKGSTAEQGEASALMEAIERYSGIFQGDEIRVTRRFTDFPSGDAILPNDVLLFSDAQYRRDQAPTTDPDEAPSAGSIRSIGQDRMVAGLVSARRTLQISSDQPLVFFLQRPRPNSTRIPTAARPATRSRKQSSRDSSSWWNGMHTQSGGTIDCSGRKWTSASSTIPTSAICKPSLPKPDAGFGCSTSPAISGFRALWRYRTGWKTGQENIEFGSGAHFDARIAVLRALTELNQFLSIGLMGGGTGEKSSLDGTTPLRLQDHPFLTPSGNPAVRPGFGSKFGRLDTREQVTACVRLAKREGLDFLVLDQTRPDIEVPVVRVIVPGMRHFYRRFAPGRLYDVPVKLGLRDRPLPENELNPLHPHT